MTPGRKGWKKKRPLSKVAVVTYCTCASPMPTAVRRQGARRLLLCARCRCPIAEER